jgi:hypothetical protein
VGSSELRREQRQPELDLVQLTLHPDHFLGEVWPFINHAKHA